MLDCPRNSIVVKIEWFHPGTTTAWRNTHVADIKHALADFGADLHAGKLRMSLVSVPKAGPDYSMAVENHKGFLRRVRATNEAKKRVAEDGQKQAQQSATDAATALASLPTSQSKGVGTKSNEL